MLHVGRIIEPVPVALRADESQSYQIPQVLLDGSERALRFACQGAHMQALRHRTEQTGQNSRPRPRTEEFFKNVHAYCYTIRLYCLTIRFCRSTSVRSHCRFRRVRSHTCRHPEKRKNQLRIAQSPIPVIAGVKPAHLPTALGCDQRDKPPQPYSRLLATAEVLAQCFPNRLAERARVTGVIARGRFTRITECDSIDVQLQQGLPKRLKHGGLRDQIV